jgi:hypothetical protein
MGHDGKGIGSDYITQSFMNFIFSLSISLSLSLAFFEGVVAFVI